MAGQEDLKVAYAHVIKTFHWAFLSALLVTAYLQASVPTTTVVSTSWRPCLHTHTHTKLSIHAYIFRINVRLNTFTELASLLQFVIFF